MWLLLYPPAAAGSSRQPASRAQTNKSTRILLVYTNDEATRRFCGPGHRDTRGHTHPPPKQKSLSLRERENGEVQLVLFWKTQNKKTFFEKTPKEKKQRRAWSLEPAKKKNSDESCCWEHGTPNPQTTNPNPNPLGTADRGPGTGLRTLNIWTPPAWKNPAADTRHTSAHPPPPTPPPKEGQEGKMSKVGSGTTTILVLYNSTGIGAALVAH